MNVNITIDRKVKNKTVISTFWEREIWSLQWNGTMYVNHLRATEHLSEHHLYRAGDQQMTDSAACECVCVFLFGYSSVFLLSGREGETEFCFLGLLHFILAISFFFKNLKFSG